jgi:hypothetical protein
MLLWLADVLRDAGLNVIEYPGWKTRGKANIEPLGVIWHHTATPRSASDAAVRKLLAGGRTDLAGPLCHLGLERDGVYVVIAAGRANHAGYGEPWGNDSIGIEAYNEGTGEPWPPAQVDAYRRGTAAICAHLALGVDRVRAHREVDPGRKVDPVGLDMRHERAEVQKILTPPKPPPEDDDMPLTPTEIGAIAKAVWDRKVHFLGDEMQPATLVMRDIATHARVGARQEIDVAVLAAAVAKALPDAATADVEVAVEKAIRSVLGSLD